MAQAGWSPSIVVGIDVGMTCTGVAYSSQDSDWASPEVMRDWPGQEDSVCGKCPTRIAYDTSGKVVGWGTCTNSPQIHATGKNFKLWLDPDFQDKADATDTHQKAVEHYVNYMGVLTKHINGELEKRFSNWQDRQIEYRFSIPTTWNKSTLPRYLLSWLARAGLTNSTNRKVILSRSEAEAAALYVAQDCELRADDVILVVDAGGATTNINLLQILHEEYGITQLKTLGTAESINIGSTMIDREARKLVEKRLKSRHVYDPRGIKCLAKSVMDRSFDYYKCSFGQHNGRPDYHASIPYREGQLITLKHAEMKAIFDGLVVRLIKKIRTQIDAIARLALPEVRCIVLCGGLGASKYIKQRLTAEFCTDVFAPRGRRNVNVLVANDPQLAVAKGLLIDRPQTIEEDAEEDVEEDNPVQRGRCCLVSYGILCRRIYNPKEHFGEPTVEDELTGDLWVEDQIDWIIQVGDIIPETGITRRYSLRLADDKQIEPFRAHVFMSELPKSNLVKSKHRAPVTRVCTVEGRFRLSEIEEDDFVKVRKQRFSIGNKQKDHIIAEFDLLITVGSTDLAFEFVSLKGRRYSEEATRLSVIWNNVES